LTTKSTLYILSLRLKAEIEARARNGRLVSESIFAVRDLARKFPDEVINILNKKLNASTGFLEHNLCIAVDLISEELHHKMKETIPILVERFTNRCYDYISLESSAKALTRIFRNHPEFIPEDLEQILTTFLKYEKRNSVVYHTKLLLDEIRK